MMRSIVRRCITSLLLCGVSAVFCAAQVPAPSATNTQQSSPSLQISSGDLIQVLVFDTPELSGNLRVAQDGSVRLPLGGEVAIAGLTPAAAANAIEAKLKLSNILLNPHVQVSIGEFATTGVTVLGEVKTPGNYPLLGSHTLPDIIAAAGGLDTVAGDDLTIVRAHDLQNPIYVAGIHSRNFAANDVHLQPGDRVTVSKAGIVYVLGDVGRAGGFIVDPNGGLTVLQALSLAQGFTRTAAQRKAFIIRKSDGSIVHLGSDIQKILDGKIVDAGLHDGDVLYIPSSLAKTFTYRGIEAAIQLGTGFAIYRQ
jgi:polysaccharide export outer membrane protein